MRSRNLSILCLSGFSVFALLLPVAGRGQQAIEENTSIAPDDPIAHLQRMIDTGEVELSFDSDHGYLRSLLSLLKIPISSQMLVFSKTSLQNHLISPKKPRALYFNDEVYVGWVQGSSAVEIASVDPKAGPIFYTLTQKKAERPQFRQHTDQNCASCHSNAPARLFMLSRMTDPLGNPYGNGLSTTDRSPFTERWGGWYVSGTHGDQTHWGNVTPMPPYFTGNFADYVSRLKFGSGTNLTELSSRVDTKPYLSQHSDIVALMIHAHQVDLHNLIALTSHRLQAAIQDEGARTQASGDMTEVLKNAGEPLLQAMLFAGAPRFMEPITGTSNFAAEFAAQGPRDRQGRSLRDVDLKQRLFRYPLSYMIYSSAFDELPGLMKEYIYRRLHEVLGGEDKNNQFAFLAPADRAAILEILKDTKPDFRKVRRSMEATPRASLLP